MPLYDWSDKYSTDIRAIDADHKGLFDAVNILHEAFVAGTVSERISSILTMLHTYVDEHFQREERFMEQAGYPELARHRTAHRKFTRTILYLEKLCQQELDKVDIEKVLTFLGDWLQDHILGTDMKYVPYLRGEKSGTEPHDASTPDPSDIVQLTVHIPQAKVELFEDIAHAFSCGTTGERFEQSLKTALEKIEAAQMDQARKLFGKTP